MAGNVRYTAVLDACVLYPASLRDLLLALAVEGTYRARWTAAIQEEWIRNLLEKRPDLDKQKMLRTTCLMNSAVEDALIHHYEYVIPTLNLPDADDRHVLAAAIVGHADAIVTSNLKDFPAETVSQYSVEILHPDDFLIAQYDLNKIGVLSIIKACRMKLKNPPKAAEDYVATLEQQGLPQTCQILRSAIGLI
jgi:predicted nucleic acid-binding protein